MSRNILGLYLAHRHELVNYARSIVGDRAHAEDVVQDAWIRLGPVTANRHLDAPVGYLYRIVRNLAIDGRRRLQREQGRTVPADMANVETTAEDRPSPEAVAVGRDELRALQAAVAELPERTRIAFEMHRFADMTYQDIADYLDISVGLAHRLVADALNHCRQRLYGG